ncbi:MAG: penicillin-binding protein 2 [candidate division WOR-3 bacterium]|nr:penicillin-binding protein 2 [candidate division WOR-3 bacterium]
MIHLQIIRGERYFRLSEANHIRKVYIPASRGKILDRNNIPLADTRPSFALSVIPCEIDSGIITKLNKIVPLDSNKIKSLLYDQAYLRTPIKIKRHLDIKIASQIEELAAEFPGVTIEIEPVRIYPDGKAFAHIIGYLGEITTEELKSDSFYKPWHYVGRYGLEAVYEKYLRGRDGIRYTEIDALGREIGPIPEKREVPPDPGCDIILTIDAELQKLAYNLLSQYQRGAVIGLDLKDGGVLCLVSYPSFDPEVLTKGISTKEWEKLANDKSAPLINRVISAIYPPGSTIKPPITSLALEYGFITENTKFAPCAGEFRYGNRKFRCLGKHGSLALTDAIVYSCNIYFYQLALKLGIDKFGEFLKFWQIDEKTGIDLLSERKGNIPTRAYLDNRYGKNRWTSGLLVNYGVGQGEILLTPLKLAVIYSAIAQEGEFYLPHLLKEIRKSDSIIYRYQPAKKNLPVSKRSFQIVKKALQDVVTRGTGWAAYMPEIAIAGKTGTAENPPYRDHAWFVGYAPVENPEVLFCVLIENVGKGGAYAAPIVRELVKKYFEKRNFIANE